MIQRLTLIKPPNNHQYTSSCNKLNCQQVKNAYHDLKRDYEELYKIHLEIELKSFRYLFTLYANVEEQITAMNLPIASNIPTSMLTSISYPNPNRNEDQQTIFHLKMYRIKIYHYSDICKEFHDQELITIIQLRELERYFFAIQSHLTLVENTFILDVLKRPPTPDKNTRTIKNVRSHDMSDYQIFAKTWGINPPPDTL